MEADDRRNGALYGIWLGYLVIMLYGLVFVANIPTIQESPYITYIRHIVEFLAFLYVIIVCALSIFCMMLVSFIKLQLDIRKEETDHGMICVRTQRFKLLQEKADTVYTGKCSNKRQISSYVQHFFDFIFVIFLLISGWYSAAFVYSLSVFIFHVCWVSAGVYIKEMGELGDNGFNKRILSEDRNTLSN